MLLTYLGSNLINLVITAVTNVVI